MRTKDQMAAAEGLAYKEGWRIRWSPAIDSPNHSKYAVAGAAVLVKAGYESLTYLMSRATSTLGSWLRDWSSYPQASHLWRTQRTSNVAWD